jgi:hypothetical protein
MDISKLTLVELKALAYDQVLLLTRTQNNLAMIEQEIQKRQTIEPEVKDEG